MKKSILAALLFLTVSLSLSSAALYSKGWWGIAGSTAAAITAATALVIVLRERKAQKNGTD